MQKKHTCIYQLSLEDVQEAIEQYLQSKGEYVIITNITPEYLQKEITIGTHDCDYVQVFNGIKVRAEV